jgi:phenylpropionate dioxygenase-like ring-hydroxylating dioxygenase large terminal subunit
VYLLTFDGQAPGRLSRPLAPKTETTNFEERAMDGDTAAAAALISKENYLSTDFLKLEKSKLWPQVWQVACRLEELKAVGDYVTYDIADESIVVVRTAADRIRAYHNVCPHRGRQLTEGCGRTSHFRCRYHGWSFDLDGNNIVVQDGDDYGDALQIADLHLMDLKVDTWGGFVFVNMNPDCEPLAEFLKPIPEFLDPFELENMRYRWYLTLTLPANWKVALEAFMEGYHVAATHPQLLPNQGDDYTQSAAHGKHSHFGYWESKIPLGQPSPRLKMGPPEDPREGVIKFFQIMEDQLAAIFTDRDCEAAKLLMEHAPADIDPAMAFGVAVELGRKAAEAEGCGYPPNLDFEKFMRAGTDWHIFPNCVTLPYFDGALWYRARPNGDDPDTCIFDIWSLKRYAPGQEPPLQRKAFTSMEGQTAGTILDQDIYNMRFVQKGMKSRAFKHARPNPVQEVEVSNFHRVLEAYVYSQ